MELANASYASVERVSCQFCNRKFVPESWAKHAVVCERTLHKKRKTFDSAKQRIQGTELAEFLPSVTTKKLEAFALPRKEKPAIVQKLMNTAQNVPSRKSSKLTSPNESSNYEKCPYCDRTFGPKAFDRHLEWCKEQSDRIETKSPATQVAKERWEARIKYRAPSFRSKRSITREKYSPKSSLSDCSSMHSKSEERNNDDVRRKKSVDVELKLKFPEKFKSNGPAKETNFIRQNVLRCSYRPRMSKKTETKSEKNRANQTKKNPDHPDSQNRMSSSGSKTKRYPRSSRTVAVTSSVASLLPKEYPDPYLLAEHQLAELLSEVGHSEESVNQTFVIKHQSPPSHHSTKEERRYKFQNKENISSHDFSGPVKTISCQTENHAIHTSDKQLKTSPTSAFERYAPMNDNRLPTSSSPHFENENFLPPISGAIRASSQTSHEGNYINRYPLISLSNLSLCSSVSIDIPEEILKLGPCKSENMRDSELPSMKPSIDKSGNNKNNVKKSLKMENMLFGDGERSTPIHIRASSAEVDDADAELEQSSGVLDEDDFDLANSFNEFENVLQSSYCDDGVHTIGSESPLEKREMTCERGNSMASKTSVDSAYNSLNRRSPNDVFELPMFYGKTSTPETDVMRSSTLSLSSDTTTASCVDVSSPNFRKLSRFCHECGAKFPLPIAKFCCECGVRRLMI